MSSTSTGIQSSETTEQTSRGESRHERRAHKRHALDLVGGLSKNNGQFVPCHIRDFCPDGMLLTVDKKSHQQLAAGDGSMSAGDTLTLRFKTNLNDEPQEHLARVRIARVTSDGFGVCFDGENAEAVWQLRQLVRELRVGLHQDLAAERRSRAPCAPMEVEQALNAGQLLEVVRERVEQYLIARMAFLFKGARDNLIASANDSTSDSNQAKHLDAMKEVQDIQDSVETAYLDTIARQFAVMVNPDVVSEPEEPSSAQELALVDTGSFDDWLTTKNIISAAESKLKKPQYDLEQRLTRLVNAPIDEENNPIGLGALCLSFHDAIQGLGASGYARRALLNAFELTVVKSLKSFYDELNALLEKSGVEATVERARKVAQTPERKNREKRKDTTESKAATERDVPPPNVVENDKPDPNSSAEIMKGAAAVLPPLRLGSAFHTAGNLLNMQRVFDSNQSTGSGEIMQGLEAWAPAQVNMEQQKELLDSLSILQRSPRFAQATDNTPLDLRSKLNSAWRSAGVDVTPNHHMMLDIVSNLIDAILDDPFVSDEVKVRVRRLAVPILKVAFQDPSFFENQQHPARQILDNLGRLDPESDEHIKEVVDPVVNGIVKDYDEDPSIFTQALRPLKAEVSKQRIIFQKNLERLVSERQTQQEFVKSRQNDDDKSEQSKRQKSKAVDQAKIAGDQNEWERWLANARRCKPGDVLSVEEQNGKRRKLTLAWVSEDKGTFVLVDSLGNKARSMTIQELAMQMKRGSVVAEDIANMALTDRGTYRMLRSLHEKLARKASHDQLTDLLTRKEFEARLDGLITESVRNTSCHVMYALDIEGLQGIVDKAGKKIAVELLIKLARLLEKNVANRGSVARLGQARFGVLLKDVSLEKGREIVERQREIIAKARCMWRGESFSLKASAGILEINDMSEGVEATIKAVEAALERTAKTGRNETKVTGTIHDPIKSQGLCNAGSTTILDMLNMDSLRLRCQRVIPLSEDNTQLPHYEILLGVQKDAGQVSLPADFIRAAVRNHEMQTVDRWVIRSVFAWLKENQDKADGVDGYSINLSINSLSDDGVLEFVLKQFSDSMVPPAKIIFEFPESAAAANVSLTTDFVTTLKSYGCRFAIDDFGMADDSFSYLNSLPVDFVKIDGKLVVDILANAKDLAVVRSINEIGHLLGKRTIAEFVESKPILTRLRELGVDYAQGFGIEKPVLLESL